MSDIWLTGDTHFSHSPNKHGYGGIIFHAKRINPLTGQLFSCIEEHDQFLIDQWNKTVGSKDTVYILGDFAWKDHNHYIGALKARKVIILGSHDRMSQDCLKNFTEVHNGMLFRVIKGIPFVMTHTAMKVWERSHYNGLNCYAHSHGRLEESDYSRQMDVGVDVSNDYCPFNVDFVIYKMSLKKESPNKRTQEELEECVRKNRENNMNLLKQWEENKQKV